MSDWYFAYGSNLWIDQMAARTGPVGTGQDRPRMAQLPDYELAFNALGEDGQVYANVVSPGRGVLGVVYRCSAEALRKLDAYEGGYERRRVRVVLDPDEEAEADVYVALAARVTRARRPGADYLERILRGARQQGLPEAYIRQIEALALRGEVDPCQP